MTTEILIVMIAQVVISAVIALLLFSIFDRTIVNVRIKWALKAIVAVILVMSIVIGRQMLIGS